MGVSENRTAKDAGWADVALASDAVQRRIGQDLHDGLGQLLTGLTYLLRALEADVPPALVPRVQRLGELAQAAVEKTAHIARGLAPFHLADASLRVVLDELARSSQELLGVTCTLTDAPSDRDDELTPAARMQLYFIGQEAIHNAQRHGGARVVTIAFAREGDARTLAFTDDGSGPAPGAREGLGTKSMRLRARSFGGTIALDVGPGGRGAQLVCTWSATWKAEAA